MTLVTIGDEIDPKSPVAGAIEIINSGTINFSSGGGNPADQYYRDLEQVVLTLHEPYSGTNIAAGNPSANGSDAGAPGGIDRILINPDLVNGVERFAGVTKENVAATLLHEMYHEMGLLH